MDFSHQSLSNWWTLHLIHDLSPGL